MNSKTQHLPLMATTLAAVGLTISTVINFALPVSAAQIVTCESSNRQRNICSVDTRNGVRIVRQLSSNSCNGNWGYERNIIWVKNGCRAEFSVGSRLDNRSDRDRDNRYSRNNRFNRDNRYDRNERFDRDNRYDRDRR